MSEELETLVKGKEIYSTASGGRYNLSVDNKKESYTYDEYCNVLKNMWESYLQTGKTPELMGLPLTENALLIETTHCVAPSSWNTPGNNQPLLPSRESFIYWLKSKSDEIGKHIEKENFNHFQEHLNDILKQHLSVK